MSVVPELMTRYCDGDVVAFRELYRVVAPRLHTYLIALTSDSTTADRVLEQAFLTLHRSRAAYIQGADPLPWIFAIAQRIFIDLPPTMRRFAE